MSFSCGIVGLPNVGKSTLFNALTSTQLAEAANYPFCTIEPNTGKVGVPDTRLGKLAKIANSEKILPVQIEFVDIAGLVKGASTGNGLGNKFLSHIREVDAIIHVLRCFVDDDITHVEGSINPVRDLEVINLELVLSDLESLEKRLPAFEKKARGTDKNAKEELDLVKKILKGLEDGKAVRDIISPDEKEAVKLLHLITSKPIMYVCNVAENDAATGNDYYKAVFEAVSKSGAECIFISSKIESEISTLADEEEKKMFLAELGLEETGLTRLIKSGYKLLDLTSFFTIGPKEARAWTVKKASAAPKAAGEIHTDFEKGFIRAETISCDDYIKYNGEAGCKEAGKMRLEGKEYIVQDGDIFHFRFNV